ncbi:ferric reductase-like transmembrane domain-containing protein [Bellilinea sp.]|uniref:ferredoxin reductase family protein n=1 Tax=Bellilinea sp. TaxID=2838785 RepID=UPI002ADE223D|nr:ferric reductase-like transmembrane domain-containing protein [Bellilinea sp.]
MMINHRLNRIFQGIFWVLVYLFLTLLPVLVMFLPPRPPGREFIREFSVALGFVGLAMMALQFALTARFKTIKAPYGADVVYHFHRQISILAFVLILVHPILLFIPQIHPVSILNIFSPDTPWRARFAVTSLLALSGLIVMALWRKPLKIEYTRWRIWHGMLATAAVAFAMLHVLGVNWYINEPWKRLLWAGYSIFFVGLLFYTRVWKPWQLLRTPYRVREVKAERGGSWSLVLEPDGHAGLQFHPGQFAWITAFNSPFKDAEHPFSFSSAPASDGSVRFTIKELGDFTQRIKELKPGDKVYVDGPYGAFSIDRHPDAKEFVFIAGGVGITPMVSMLHTLAQRNDQRPLLLIYGGRDLESLTLIEEIEELKNRLNLRVVYVLEKPPAGWEGETGYITRKVLERWLPPERRKDRTEIFVCGPLPMMNSVEDSLTKMGFFSGDVHSERFDLV